MEIKKILKSLRVFFVKVFKIDKKISL